MADAEFVNPWRKVDGDDVFDSRFFRVRSDMVRYRGQPERPYASIRFKQIGALVVPIDDDGCTTLVGQYRYVVDKFTWEIPAGGGAINEPPLESAKKELLEETGYQAAHWLPLLTAHSNPGNTDEEGFGFVAWGLSAGVAPPSDDEMLVSRKLRFSEALQLALGGHIGTFHSIALLLALDARAKRGDLPDGLLKLLTLE